jgi:AraC-like DNA-binding protein
MADRFRLNGNWKLVAHDLGVDTASLLRLAGQPEDLFRREAAWVDAQGWFAMWDALEQVMGDESAALMVGTAVRPEGFDPSLFAAVCSQDMNQASRRLSQYKALIGPMKLSVQEDEAETSLALGSAHVARLPRFLGFTELVFLTNLARMSTRHRIAPRAVRAPVAWGDEAMAEYAAWFGCPIEQGPWALVFGAEDAARPFLTANAAMFEFFEPELRRRLSEVEVEASTRERVEAALRELLPSGRSSIGDVARALGMSRRSLQRSLRGEGVSFREVLSGTREELARFYLRTPDLASAEISFLLGYDDPSSFFRAFRSWTGSTPEQVRAAG